jgi:hypothetical protein
MTMRSTKAGDTAKYPTTRGNGDGRRGLATSEVAPAALTRARISNGRVAEVDAPHTIAKVRYGMRGRSVRQSLTCRYRILPRPQRKSPSDRAFRAA